MKIKDIIKKQTTIIAIAVILVTIAVIGVSYAIFFNVNKNTDDQVITAGNLELTVSGISALKLTEPMTTAEGLASNPIRYTVVNTASNLPASYTLYIYAGSGNNIPLSSIKVSTDGSSSTVLSSLTPTISEGSTTYYQIDTGSLAAAASSTTTKTLRIWIDEDLVADEINNGNLNLQLYVVSEVDEGYLEKSYFFSKKLNFNNNSTLLIQNIKFINQNINLNKPFINLMAQFNSIRLLTKQIKSIMMFA